MPGGEGGAALGLLGMEFNEEIGAQSAAGSAAWLCGHRPLGGAGLGVRALRVGKS